MLPKDGLGGIPAAVCGDMLHELCGSIQTFSHGTGYVNGSVFYLVLMEVGWLLPYQVEKPIKEKMLILRLCLNHEKCHWNLNNMNC